MSGRKPSGTRIVAIIVVAMAAGASFALGYFVGRTAGGSRVAEAPPQFMPLPESGKIPEAEKIPEKTASAQPVTEAEPELERNASVERPHGGSSERPQGGQAKRPAKADAVYYIQAAAFRDPRDAESLQAKLKALGYNAYIKAVKQTSHGNIFRVRVGRFGDRKEAEVLALKLKKSEGLEAFVTGLD